MSVGLQEPIISGPFLLAALLSAAAGAVSFASPCVVPLVPGYLAYLVGLVGTPVPIDGGFPAASNGSAAPAAELAGSVRSRTVLATLLFIAGFTVVFLAQSALFLGWRTPCATKRTCLPESVVVSPS